MKKNVCTIIFVFTIFNNIISQEMKTYSGNYLKGEATYQYYENKELERIFHGSFKYTCWYENIATMLKKNYEITGFYKENKKEGAWKGIFSRKYPNDPLPNLIMVEKGNFKNGLRQDKWTYNYTVNSKSIKTMENTTNLYFKNDVLVNTILSLENNDLKGTIDSNGIFTGEWYFLTSNKEVEHIIEINNNIITKYIVRDKTDGKLLLKHIPKIDLLLLQKLDSLGIINYLKVNNFSLDNLSSYSDGSVPYYADKNKVNNDSEEMENDNRVRIDENEINGNDIQYAAKYFEEFWNYINSLHTNDTPLQDIGITPFIIKYPNVIHVLK